MTKNKLYRITGGRPGGPALELVLTLKDDLVISMRGGGGATLGAVTLPPTAPRFYERQILMCLADCTVCDGLPQRCAACGQCRERGEECASCGGEKGWRNVGEEDGGG